MVYDFQCYVNFGPKATDSTYIQSEIQVLMKLKLYNKCRYYTMIDYGMILNNTPYAIVMRSTLN